MALCSEGDDAVNEQEWLAGTNPLSMLQFLLGKARDRKLRLFAVACCRRIWTLLPDETGKRLVDLAERVAERKVTPGALREGMRLAGDPTGDPAAAALASCMPTAPQCQCGASLILRRGSRRSFYGCSNYPLCRNTQAYWNGLAGAAEGAALATGVPDPWAEYSMQARLLRDIFRNPFRPFPGIHPSWQTWQNSTIPALAQSLYDDRAFDRLPVLADALEEAGCQDAEILTHCRQPGVHARGCWVVDLLLGKT
jgi:ssDNA-binding Zn-finger/Zn-ribbon topoisomerase 1